MISKLLPTPSNICLVLLATALFSCKKTEDLKKADTTQPASLQYAVEGWSDLDGVMVAYSDVEYFHTDTGEIQFSENKAAAFFKSEDGSAPFVDAGTVKMDTVLLQYNTETGVYEIPELSFPFGYNFTNKVTWAVSGNVQNEISPINISLDSFPDQPIVDTNIFFIKKGKTFTLKMLDTLGNTNTNVYNVFTIKQGNKAASHRLNASSVEYVFPIQELAQFDLGVAEIQVASYMRAVYQVPGSTKKVYILNGRRTYRMVEIIN